MTPEQASHMAALAAKIEAQLSRASRRIEIFKDQSMIKNHCSVEQAENIVKELDWHWSEIKSIMDDMLPQLRKL